MDKIKVVCRALFLNDINQILFVKKTGSDFWSLPGGKLDSDDTSVQDCLIREIKEELGVMSTINEIKFVQELHKNDTRYIELIWEASLSVDPCINQINIQEVSDGELIDIKWFDKENLHNENVKPEFLKNTFKN